MVRLNVAGWTMCSNVTETAALFHVALHVLTFRKPVAGALTNATEWELTCCCLMTSLTAPLAWSRFALGVTVFCGLAYAAVGHGAFTCEVPFAITLVADATRALSRLVPSLSAVRAGLLGAIL